MPVFLVPAHAQPLREFNTCHAPAGTAVGGQFCATDNQTAHIIPPGKAVDLDALVRGSDIGLPGGRHFLFNPRTRELIVGGVGPDAEQSHAGVAHTVGLTPHQYDRANVHGYLIGQGGKFTEVRISRVITGDEDYDDSAGARLEQFGMVQELVDRLKGTGAPGTTRFMVYQWGGWPGFTLEAAFPEVYHPKKKRAESFTLRMREAATEADWQRVHTCRVEDWIREANDCHAPAGSPAGGQFCSTSGSLPGLRHYARPKGSADIPDVLKADVLAARRAGIEVFHAQQPEPVMGVEGMIHDPLARSHAQGGETTYYDKEGRSHLARRGRVYITTRGGAFEPDREVWVDKYGFNVRREKKELTPEMLTADLRATVEDVVSTFRHEVGHIMDDSHTRGKIGGDLAREIRAWQYAVEISPDHRVSRAMVQRGLESHAYSVFRKQALPDEMSWLKRTSLWEMDEALERVVTNEMRSGVVNIEAHRKARAFTARVLQSLDAYGTVLRKKGIVRVPEPLLPSYFSPYTKKRTLAGPGGRGPI